MNKKRTERGNLHEDLLWCWSVQLIVFRPSLWSRQTRNVCWGRTWERRICHIVYTCSAWRRSEFACEREGWSGRRRLYHNEHIHKASLQCEISCGPEVTTVWRKPCHKQDTCVWGCASGCAWKELACSRTPCDNVDTSWPADCPGYDVSAYGGSGWRRWRTLYHIHCTCTSDDSDHWSGEGDSFFWICHLSCRTPPESYIWSSQNWQESRLCPWSHWTGRLYCTVGRGCPWSSHMNHHWSGDCVLWLDSLMSAPEHQDWNYRIYWTVDCLYFCVRMLTSPALGTDLKIQTKRISKCIWPNDGKHDTSYRHTMGRIKHMLK